MPFCYVKERNTSQTSTRLNINNGINMIRQRGDETVTPAYFRAHQVIIPDNPNTIMSGNNRFTIRVGPIFSKIKVIISCVICCVEWSNVFVDSINNMIIMRQAVILPNHFFCKTEVLCESLIRIPCKFRHMFCRPLYTNHLVVVQLYR